MFEKVSLGEFVSRPEYFACVCMCVHVCVCMCVSVRVHTWALLSPVWSTYVYVVSVACRECHKLHKQRLGDFLSPPLSNSSSPASVSLTLRSPQGRKKSRNS